METQRGRRSASAVALRPVVLLERPKAPEHLNNAVAHEWAQVVGAMPADHFGRETWPMLEGYCRHVITARKVASLIEQLELSGPELNVREWQRLLSLQDRENRAISDLAMKMRLSQSSRQDKTKPVHSGGVAKPWD